MTTTTGRIPFIDAYKAFLICLVVLGHAVQGTVADFDANPVTKLIYSHHMAAFFFLSGLVAWKPQFDLAKLPARLGHLLVPFFLWWAIPKLPSGPANLFAALHGLLRTPDSGLWFLFVLAGCHLIYGLVRALADRLRLNEDLLPVGALALLMVTELATGYAHYGFHFLAWYFIFFLAGSCVRKHVFDKLLDFSKRPSSLFAAGILFLIWLTMTPFWQRNTTITLPVLGALPTALAFAYRLLAASCAIGAAMLCLVRIKAIPGWVAVLGQCTMGIYILHPWILPVILKHTAAIPTELRILAATFITVPLATILTLAIRRIPVIGKWIA